jgi:TatD DNase family protein
MSDQTYASVPEALVVGVFDNHTHLDPSGVPGTQTLDYHAHLDKGSSVGVRGVVQVGTDVESSLWSSELAAIEPRVLAAVALHPNEAPRLAAAGRLDDALASIDDFAGRPRVRAIGETGLDYFRTGEDGRDAQHRSFEAHIEIAKKHGLALQIHDRDAHDDVVETLLRVGAPEKTVFHCFSADADLARIAVKNGWYLSFSGTVTFKNAHDLREALEVAPRHLLLVETDAPYLTPDPFRGRLNSPYMLPHTLRGMAKHLGTDVSMLAAQITSNTEEVYGRWDAEPVTAPRDAYTDPTFEMPPMTGSIRLPYLDNPEPESTT